MTALQVLKELKKEKWPELKTGEYNLPLILAAMHKFAELRQCNVSGSLPSDLKEKYHAGYRDGWNDACDEYNVGCGNDR